MLGLNPEALNPSGQMDQGLEIESNSDEEDAELARLLESASASAGLSKGKAKAKFEFDSEEEGEQDYYYSDFFGPGGAHLAWPLSVPHIA